MAALFRPFLRDALSAGASDVARDATRDAARDAVGDAAHDVARDAAAGTARDTACNATGSELSTAARDTVHESADVAAREAGKTARQGMKSTPGIILASATGASTIGATAFGLWKANQTVDNGQMHTTPRRRAQGHVQ